MKKATDHIYKVEKGEVVEDFTASQSGFVWFNEVGLLGKRKVYSTVGEAKEALVDYALEHQDG